MENIVRTFEEKISDARKLEKELEQLKKLRTNIDKQISDKMKSPLMNYKQYIKETLPQIQNEMKLLRDVGLEEPVSFDDKMDYAITRNSLSDSFTKHFVGLLSKDKMPFQGIGPLFGIRVDVLQNVDHSPTKYGNNESIK